MHQMHEEQSFTPVNRERWDRIKADIKAKMGIDITEDIGEQSGDTPLGKVTVSYHYDEPAQTVTIKTLKVPFLLSEEIVDQKIHTEIEHIQ